MKSSKRFISLTVLIILLAAGLTSCGNLLMAGIDEKGETAVSGQASTGGKAAIGSISGSVTAEGALPAQLVRRPASTAAAAKTAFPNADFSSEDYIYTAKLLQSNTVIKTTVFNGNSYSFGNLDNGTYKISVEVTKDEKVVLSGSSGTITISDETPSVTPAPLLLEPTTTGTGNINLRVYSESSDVKKVDAWLVTNNDTISETFTFSEGHADIVFTNVKAYSLTLEFYKEVAYGNETRQVLAYQCKEVVNVFDNMTTDTWVKNGQEMYLEKNTETGTATFNLTEDLLKDFEMNTYYVDSNLAEGRNNGSPFDPFHTLEQAVVAVKGSKTADTKSIFIKAGTTVQEPGEVISVTSYNGGIVKTLTIDIYDRTDENRTATIEKVHQSTFVTVGDNSSDSTLTVNNIKFTNPNKKEIASDDITPTWIQIFTGGSVTLSNCSFEDSINDYSIDNSSQNTYIENCTFTGKTDENKPASSIYCRGGSRLHLKGNAHKFEDDNEIFLVSGGNDDTVTASIWIEQDFNQNTKGTTIPVYIANPFHYDNKNVFYYSVSGNLEKFALSDNTYNINEQGKLFLTKLYVDSNSENDVENGLLASPYKTISAALTAANSLSSSEISVFIKDGTEEHWGLNSSLTLSKSMTVKVYKDTPETADSNPGTATIYLSQLNGRFIIDKPFSAIGLTFDAQENKINPVLNINNSSSFSNCSFKNLTAGTTAGYFYADSNVTFTDCVFSKNTHTMYISPNGSVTFVNKISIDTNAPIQIGGSDSGFGKIVLAESFDPQTSPWKLSIARISDGSQIITGKKFDNYNQIFTVPEGYSINSEGKYKKQVFPKTITAGERYTIEPTSNTTADDINNFLSKGNFEFTVDLDLSEMAPDEIKKINVSLPHVETLVLPKGTSFDDNQFGGDSENKGSTLKKVIIKGDVTGVWMFQSCNTIEEVVFEEGVTEIPDGMFSKCTSLKTVSLPSTLKTIGYHAFADSAIEEITIPASVTTIKHFAFYSTEETYSSDYKLRSVSFEDTSHTWAIKQGGIGSPLSFEATDQDNISVSNPSSNANYFKQTWGCSEGYWWVKNE